MTEIDELDVAALLQDIIQKAPSLEQQTQQLQLIEALKAKGIPDIKAVELAFNAAGSVN